MTRWKRPRQRTLVLALAAYKRDCDRAALKHGAMRPSLFSVNGHVTINGLLVHDADVLSVDIVSAP